MLRGGRGGRGWRERGRDGREGGREGGMGDYVKEQGGGWHYTLVIPTALWASSGLGQALLGRN